MANNEITIAQNINYIMHISALPNTAYWMQDIQLPAMSINPTMAEGFPLDVPLPGEKATFDPLTAAFVVDENWKNWEEAFRLMYDSVSPTDEGTLREKHDSIPFDVRITVLNSNKEPILYIDFIDAIPTTLDGVTFDSATDRPQPLLSALTFEYSYMKVTRINEI